MSNTPKTVTDVLAESGGKKPAKVAEQLLPLVYNEMRALAAGYFRDERIAHTLQPTALVHEAYLRLVDQKRVDWQGRTHFFAVGACIMRRILIDHARGHGRAKRGADWQRVLLTDTLTGAGSPDLEVLELNDALEALAALDPQQSEIVELRFFGGLTVEEVAHLLGVSKRKVEGDWTHAKAWLKSRIGGTTSP